MKNLCLPEIGKYRDHEADKIYQTANHERALGGAFMVPGPPAPAVPGRFSKRAVLRVVASAGRDQQDPEMRWDHVSVSLKTRCPTWEEMAFIKRLFFKPDEVCFELHPAQAQNISNHPYCLHLWRPIDQAIPLPPAIMVGFPGLELQP
jgi:hypothetical protein